MDFLFLEVEDDISMSSSSEEANSALPEMLDFLGFGVKLNAVDFLVDLLSEVTGTSISFDFFSSLLLSPPVSSWEGLDSLSTGRVVFLEVFLPVRGVLAGVPLVLTGELTPGSWFSDAKSDGEYLIADLRVEDKDLSLTFLAGVFTNSSTGIFISG